MVFQSTLQRPRPSPPPARLAGSTILFFKSLKSPDCFLGPERSLSFLQACSLNWSPDVLPGVGYVTAATRDASFKMGLHAAKSPSLLLGRGNSQ